MGNAVKTFFSSLLIVFATLFAAPAFADDACKNLFNADRMFAGRGAYYEKNADGTWKQKQNDMKAWAEIWENYTTLQPGTYTISTTGANVRFACKIVSDPSRDFMSQTPIMTFTLDQQENFVCKIFAIDGTYPNEIGNIQLERGSTATAYQPYNPLCATCDGTIVNYTSVTENDVPAGVQNGTPTPENPIEPVWYTQSDMILRRIGDYADSYDATTGKITRRVGVKVLKGNENWDYGVQTLAGYRFPRDVSFFGSALPSPSVWYCTHYLTRNDDSYNIPGYATRFNGTTPQVMFSFAEEDLGITSSATAAQATAAFKTWLAQQYDAGTPVTVYYPLPESKWYTEDWPSSYCQPTIRIATTAYNTARFNPVKTDLNNAVATIREIVTNTINQTAAIASLQADKQTRPEDACPAGKKCLLVETEENGVIVPHWFPIIEAPTD